MSLLGTLTSSVSALDAFTTGLDNIGNNIANINTNAFKSTAVNFSDTLTGLGTEVSGTSTNFSQGALDSTGVPTNLGVSGSGYFIVKDPATGNEYATRDGSFSINTAGYLVNSQGYRVEGLTGGTAGAAPSTLGDIQLGTPPTGTTLTSVSFATNGNMVETYSDGSQAATNQVLLQSFTDPAMLTTQGGDLFSNLANAGPLTATLGAANAPNAGGLGTILGGTLEQSNVDLTQEFSQMITMQRAFEANARILTVSDTILETVVNLKTH
jgi:flagellar hook protein FlgE